METRYAVVNRTGNVTNIAAWNGSDTFTPGDGLTLIQSDTANVGDSYAGNGQFITNPPTVQVPMSVTAAQIRIALIRAGLLDKVNSAITNGGAELAAWWDYAPLIERSNRYVAQQQKLLGLTDAQVDALFIAAAQMQP